jgi:16S rRNA (cytosine1402-N4)-methyltransferase
MFFFKNCQGKIVVDATAGGGGHLALLVDAVGSTGKIFAFDRDLRAHQKDAAGGILEKAPEVVKLFHKPFSEIKPTLKNLGIHGVDGLLCDLGVSSNQLDDQYRGFSFMADGPLDMRMDTSTGISAYEWLEKTSEHTIADVLYQLGGEKKSRAIARRIKESWPIANSSLALAKLIVSASKRRKWSKIHPATRSFQAIRMAVNQETDELAALLADLKDLLAKDGVAVFLSFHSVEDRMIKTAFKQLQQKVYHDSTSPKTFEILTKKPITASSLELKENRRARSAKLRAIKRIS